MDIYNEALRVVQESRQKHLQENILPVLVETTNLLSQIVFVQQDLLQIYEENLVPALAALLPTLSGLTPEQAEVIRTSGCALQKSTILRKRLEDLFAQAADKKTEAEYLLSIAQDQQK